MESNPLISNRITHIINLSRAQFIHMRDYIRNKPNQLILCLNFIEQNEKENKSAVFTNEVKEKMQNCVRNIEKMQNLLSEQYCVGESYRLNEIIQEEFQDLALRLNQAAFRSDGCDIFHPQTSQRLTEGLLLMHNPNITEEFYEKNKDYRWEDKKMKAMFEYIKNPPDRIQFPSQQIMPPQHIEKINESLEELKKMIESDDNDDHSFDISSNINLTVDFIVEYYSKNAWDMKKIGSNFRFNMADIVKLDDLISKKIRSGDRIYNGMDDNYEAEEDLVNNNLHHGFCANPNFEASFLKYGHKYDAQELMKNWFLWDIRAFRRSFNKDVRERCYLICLNTKHIVPETITAVILKYIDYR
jgi:hypothetical protein